MADTSTRERRMERKRGVSGDADATIEQLRAETPTRPGGERPSGERPSGERPAAPPAHEVEVKRPAEPDDVVHEASDDSFPASDPPST
jgi:hypothetical protein